MSFARFMATSRFSRLGESVAENGSSRTPMKGTPLADAVEEPPAEFRRDRWAVAVETARAMRPRKPVSSHIWNSLSGTVSAKRSSRCIPVVHSRAGSSAHRVCLFCLVPTPYAEPSAGRQGLATDASVLDRGKVPDSSRIGVAPLMSECVALPPRRSTGCGHGCWCPCPSSASDGYQDCRNHWWTIGQSDRRGAQRNSPTAKVVVGLESPASRDCGI